MAWSDAARAAAAEVRRAHAKAKTAMTQVPGLSVVQQQNARIVAARAIRDMRAGAAPLHVGVLRNAAGLTYLRNFRRKEDRFRVMPSSAHGAAVGTIYLRKR